MPVFTVYNQEGKAVSEIEQPEIFQQEVSPSLIHRYFVWVRTMIRNTVAHTKTRGEVSGGGKKPWKQKGTGRARVGSSRSPIWRKGGTVFGPRKEQTWATRMPRGERRKAMVSALSAQAKENHIAILESLDFKTPQTSAFESLIATIPTTAGKKVLHIHDSFDKTVFNSTKNLPYVTSKTISYVNIMDVLNNDAIVMTKAALQELDKHFA